MSQRLQWQEVTHGAEYVYRKCSTSLRFWRAKLFVFLCHAHQCQVPSTQQSSTKHLFLYIIKTFSKHSQRTGELHSRTETEPSQFSVLSLRHLHPSRITIRNCNWFLVFSLWLTKVRWTCPTEPTFLWYLSILMNWLQHCNWSKGTIKAHKHNTFSDKLFAVQRIWLL